MNNLLRSHPINMLCINDDDYPTLLKQIDNPPKILYYRGDIKIANKPTVSVVGSRSGTSYGRWVATSLGEKLASYGIPLVSGMALGVDTFGHFGALLNKGETIGVLGSGLDVCYPKENEKLMMEIIEKGLLISEYPPGFKPTKYSFPARNRIISGISIATIIVEARTCSGSLITAEFAEEQGRSVYAVPGNINSIYSMGTNKLIRDGVTSITTIDDIIDDLGIKRINDEKLEKNLGNDEKTIYYSVKKSGETTVKEISKVTGIDKQSVNSILTILEIKGLVFFYLGKIFIAK